MIAPPNLQAFSPHLPDAAGVISWVHIGDLHMTEAGEQNHLDLISIVEEINHTFAGSIAFVYIPGDGRTLYTATRSTGQVEEGPVGFSITNIDGHVISWNFCPSINSPWS